MPWNTDPDYILNLMKKTQHHIRYCPWCGSVARKRATWAGKTFRGQKDIQLRLARKVYWECTREPMHTFGHTEEGAPTFANKRFGQQRWNERKW